MSDVTHVVVMGVAGAGKTTLAERLSDRLRWPCADADNLHSPANVAKMASGSPLNEHDRQEWLANVRNWADQHGAAGTSTVIACSALRRTYRDIIRTAHGRVLFVHLQGDEVLINERMQQRTGHFMPVTLLPSQFALLEPLEPDEDGFTLPADRPIELLVDQALERIGRQG